MDSKRKKFGVIGHPIEHSLSPVMHNAVFRKLELDYEYSAFDVKRGELEKFIEDAKSNFIGLNVTIPHKIAVMKFLDEIGKEAELIGAVNTIKFKNGKTTGFNTDGIGCVKALEEAGEGIKEKRILILGAGGAARAIAFQLVLENSEVLISNRNMENAFKLGEDIKKKLNKDVELIRFSKNEIEKKLQETDILINATPVGMFPEVDKSIINPEIIPSRVVVMDIVYNPIKTKLLGEAEKRGCKTVDGVGMFIHQGAESLRLWLGITPPVDVMRRAVIEGLRGFN